MLFSTFPTGLPGVGLLFLRLAVSSNAIICGVNALASSNGNAFTIWAGAVFAIALGVALLVGFLTPFASVLGTISYLSLAFSSFLQSEASHCLSSLTALDLAAVSLALLLLGPGAFSFDVRLFGRREIIIPEGRRPPRS